MSERKIYLIDVAEGRATMEEYAAGRTDLSEEQRDVALRRFNALAVSLTKCVTKEK